MTENFVIEQRAKQLQGLKVPTVSGRCELLWASSLVGGPESHLIRTLRLINT